MLTIEVAPDVIGWVGLNTATRYGNGLMGVNPNVGVRHQGLHRLMAEIEGAKFHGYVPPSIATNVGYLMAEPAAVQFEFREGAPIQEAAESLADAVAKFGLPFMRSYQDIDRVLEDLDKFALWEDASERLIAGYLLLGRDPHDIERMVDQRIATQESKPGNIKRVREFLDAALANT